MSHRTSIIHKVKCIALGIIFYKAAVFSVNILNIKNCLGQHNILQSMLEK